MKRKPTGFVAICQFGVLTGAMDATRTAQKEAGKILGRWLADGCTVEPKFESRWQVTVKPCECAARAARRE